MIKRYLSNRKTLIFLIVLGILVVLWQIPAVLRTLPSRYAAAYLPDSMQQLAAREHVELLPTAEISIDPNELIDNYETSTNKVQKSNDELASYLSSEVIQIDEEAESESPPPILESPENGSSNAPVRPKSTASPQTSTPAPTKIPLPANARLEKFRHQFQTWNNCGPATLAMGLSYFDLFLSQEQTASVLKPDPEDRNVSPTEMVDYVNNNSDLGAISRANGSLATLLRFIAEGYPVIVELGLDPPGEYRWMDWYGHYLLVVAYDLADESIWVYDSWFGTSEIPGENADQAGRQISFEDLDRYWNQFNRTYIVIFEEDERSEIEEIIGENIDDAAMWQGSLENTKEALRTDPQDEYLWFNLGTVYNALGNYERAAGAFDQARAIGLPWRMLWYQFGPYEAYYQVGRYGDVVLLADVTLQNRPYFEEAYYYKGLALKALGDQDGAKSNFEKANRFNPGYRQAQIALEAFDS